MSRFSIAHVMGRRGSTSDVDHTRPSLISSVALNRQLTEEAKASDLHLFFGPQSGMFDARAHTRVIHGERKIQKNAKRVW